MTDSTIFVKLQLPGFHHWPNATPRRNYLGDRHRHLFGITVEMAAPVDDARSVEFHDLMDEVRDWWGDGEAGGSSCETMALELAKHLVTEYKRDVTVTVDEDGEAGARVAVHHE